MEKYKAFRDPATEIAPFFAFQRRSSFSDRLLKVPLALYRLVLYVCLQNILLQIKYGDHRTIKRIHLASFVALLAAKFRSRTNAILYCRIISIAISAIYFCIRKQWLFYILYEAIMGVRTVTVQRTSTGPVSGAPSSKYNNYSSNRSGSVNSKNRNSETITGSGQVYVCNWVSCLQFKYL